MLQILSWEMGARGGHRSTAQSGFEGSGGKPCSGGSPSPAVSSHSEDDTHRVQAAIPCLVEFSILRGNVTDKCQAECAECLQGAQEHLSGF